MPFITQKERLKLFLRNQGDQPETEGQECYLEYKWMVEAWRANPRWLTAVLIYETVFDVSTPNYAAELAWQVFFQLHVMPYELKQRELNGDI